MNETIEGLKNWTAVIRKTQRKIKGEIVVKIYNKTTIMVKWV